MENSIIKKLDRIVSAFILGVIGMLILFMAGGFIKGFINLAQLFFEHKEAPIEQMLHAIAVTLIFVKAYKILTSYYLDHHISIKFLVEIAIIACTVEVLFNAKNMELPLLIVLALFGMANTIVYLLFADKLESLDHREAAKPGA
jgi:uncharacterized membrane protein (DUF373 family)